MTIGFVGENDTDLAKAISADLEAVGFKTEVVHRRGPWRSLEAVEFATLGWVD